MSRDLPRPKSRLLSDEAPIYCNLSLISRPIIVSSLVLLHAALISLPNFRWLFHHVACEGGVWPFVLGIGTCHPTHDTISIPVCFPSQSEGAIFAFCFFFFWSCVWFSNVLEESDASWHASRPIQPLNDLERRKMAMDWTTAYRRRRCSSPRPVTATQHNLYCHGGTRSACVYWVNSTQRSAPNRTTLLIYRTPSGLEWSYYGRTSECAGLYLASWWFCVGGFICCRSISALA